MMDQIGYQCGDPIVVPFGPAIFDLHIASLDISCFAQALVERAQPSSEELRREAAETSNGRHSRLLRDGNVRPCRCPAESDKEIPPPHSITSSACACRLSGTVIPRAFAVLRLMTSSNLVDCATGRSDGLAPLRILST